MKQSNLERLVAEVTVSLPALNATLQIRYAPAQLRGDWPTLSRRLQRDGIGLLADALLGWDLLDDADQPLPITKATLRTLPFMLLLPLWTAVLEDFSTRFLPPKQASGTDGPNIPDVIRRLLDDVDWGEDEA